MQKICNVCTQVKSVEDFPKGRAVCKPCRASQLKDYMHKTGRSKFYAVKGKPNNDLTGKRYGKIVVVSWAGTENGMGYWNCVCDCGKYTKVSLSALHRGATKSCGCSKYAKGSQHPLWTGYGEISGQFWASISASANKRNIQLDITIEDIWNIFEKQNRECALTGLKLVISSQGVTTASLDRIDNTRGYTKDNVWWIHKDLNIMKNHFGLDYCLSLWSKAVANHISV